MRCIASTAILGLFSALGFPTCARAATGPSPDFPLHSLTPPVFLPDGLEFKTWESPTTFTQAYYVNQSHPAASDDNPGTQDKPFKTISRAAQLLQPGQRVVIASGVYREHVKPARGGSSPSAMISYEAAPNAKVILKASAIFAEKWQPSADGKTFAAPLAAHYFPKDYNPFNTDNVTPEQFVFMKSWAWDLRDKIPYTLPRGIIFQYGQPLTQLPTKDELARKPGCYWIDRPNQVIHIHPLENANPNNALFEITTQRIAFGPDQIGLGFIRVKGLVVEQVGNAFPMQQEGAISTWRGHHWIIEDNTIRYANGVGIDVGNQFGGLPQPPLIGRHIVRNNSISDIGVCAIAGIGRGPDFGLLIENNTIRRSAYHDVERLYETAGIKTHLNTHCLIRRNLIIDTLHGPGIWMDWANEFSRCSQNIIINTNTQWHGGIFVEASFKPNLIDHNFIWRSTANGIYEHDGANQIFVHNFIAHSTGPAINLKGKVTDRLVYGQPIVAGSHRAMNNIFYRNANTVSENPKNTKSTIADNLADNLTATFNPDTLEVTWSVTGPIPTCPQIDFITHDFFARPRTAPTPPGPFTSLPSTPTPIRLLPR